MFIDWLPTSVRNFSRRTRHWMAATRRASRQRRTPALLGVESLEHRLLPVLGINTLPIALPDTYVVTQGTQFNGTPSVLSNDVDLDDDTLHAVLMSAPQNGSFTLNDDGTFTYTPGSTFAGIDSFTYLANDGQANSIGLGLVTLIVNPLANRPPVAQDDYFTMSEDSILDLSLGTPLDGILENDTDPDVPDLLQELLDGSSVLLANLVSTTQHGSLLLLPTGTFVYVPEANYHGVDSFTYQGWDGLSLSNVATAFINVGSTNDAPASLPDIYTIDEDTPLNVTATGVLANDIDLDGDPLTAAIVNNPAHGSVTLNPNGSFTYTPDLNFFGLDTFTYRASDGTAFGATTLVSIVVNPVHDTPVAVNDAYSVNEDSSLLIVAGAGVLSNDTDGDGLVLSAAVIAQPQHGTLVFVPTGGFTYLPDANFNGTDSFTYQAADLTSTSNIATVTISVAGANDPPLASNDSFSVNEDQPLIVGASGVLNNDSDLEGNSLTAAVDTQPAHGTLTFNADGSFTYTPHANFNGADSFTYRANDGTTNSNVATVNLTVNSINDVPAVQDDAYTTSEDTALTVPAPAGVLANDGDPENNPLTTLLVTQPIHGSVTLQANGAFIYTPDANYSGPDSFSYRVSDTTAFSATATVSLTVTPVNDAPVAAANLYATVVDTPLVVFAPSGVLANDTDAESQPLIALLGTPTQFGNLVFNSDGSFSYTPSSAFQGTDSFTYQASDGTGLSGLTVVTITVSGTVNSAPFAAPDAFQLQEDATLDLTKGTALGGILANDTDADFPVQPALHLTASLVSLPQHGTLVLSGNGTFTYTPQANFSGTDSFTYLASDSTTFSNVATVTLTITGSNDAPVSVGDNYLAVEDTPLTITVNGVLTNDADADNDSLTAALVANAVHGNVTLNANGSFTYVPVVNYSGPDSFTYRAHDGKVQGNLATVNLIVTGVNDAPVANGETYHVNEDTSLIRTPATGVLFNDSDADGNSLTATVVGQPQRGTLSFSANGAFTYAPNNNFSGTDSFVYQISDGLSLSNLATVTIIVDPINDAPVANDDSYSTAGVPLNVNGATGVLSNDLDADNGTLSANLLAVPQHGQVAFNSNGSFVYTPANGYVGPDSFTYQASDGTLVSATATVNLSVTTAPNRAPVASDNSYQTTEDSLFATTLANGVLLNDSDPDGSPLSATLIAGPAHGALQLHANGTFSYTPDANYYGPDSFTYQASDGALNSGVATVTLSITRVNDAPVGMSDTYSINQNQSLLVTGPGVLLNDSDVDGDALTVVLVAQPLHGTLDFKPNGSFTYTPDANYFGADSFTYRVNDGLTNSSNTTVNLSISGANHVPVSANDSYTTIEDTTLTILAVTGLLSNDSDADGNTLTASVVAQPSHGILVVAANGSLVYTPDANFTGTDTFSYAASDGTASGTAAIVTITITGVNDDPESTNDSFTTAEDAPLNISASGVLANDTDVDGNALTAVPVTSPSHGTLTLNASGAFVYTPNSHFTGTDSFTYRASDGLLTGNLATVTITVTANDDPPVVITSHGNRTVKGGRKIVLDTAVTVIDANSPRFTGGQLNVMIQSGAGTRDTLRFGTGGARRGFVNVRRGIVRVGTVQVGTLTGGLRGVPIHILFNSNATLARVRSVAESVLFRGSHREPGVRVVSFQVVDDTNLTSNLGTKSVEVT